MAKKKSIEQYNVAVLQPDELNALKATVKEFMERASNIDNEIELLKEDRKELIEEYAEKLDVKVLKAALSVPKIEQGIQHKDTYELFLEVLRDPST